MFDLIRNWLATWWQGELDGRATDARLESMRLDADARLLRMSGWAEADEIWRRPAPSVNEKSADGAPGDET